MIPSNKDPLLGLLQKHLGRQGLKAAVTASNLANVETPGFKAQEVRFLEALGAAKPQELGRTRDGHLDPFDTPTRALVVEAPTDRMRPDGNTVDLDLEMMKMASIRGKFLTTVQLAKKRFALLRYAVTDGKG